MQAFADGKTIEMLCQNDKWKEADEPNFEGDPKYYRVKPEGKYRQFKYQEECWNEMHKHPDFGWGLNNVGEYVNLSRISNDSIFTKGDAFNFNKALKDFRFTDGTPFGIIEE